MKVSIIIPTKNEEGNIRNAIESVRNFSDEILVIDGHSQDRTREIVESMGVRLVTDNGLGKGDAVRCAIKESRAEILVFIDADGSHDPRDIPALIALIEKGEADLVIASRRKGGSDELYGDWNKFFREFGSNLINHRFKTAITDSQNGFRAIRKTVADKLNLKENITTIEQEMLIKVLKNGCRVAEVPSHEYKRRFGQSIIKLSRVWWRYIYSCIKYLYF
jgi:glycosyltransferase involved in cell wall biosynthesis